MQFDVHCIDCLVHRQFRLALSYGDAHKADAYLRDVMQIMLDAPAGVSAPWLSGRFAAAFATYWPGEDAYAQLKRQSNDLVLGLLPQIRPIVEQAEDPLEMALKIACTGNFLDFGILTPETAHKELHRAIGQAPQIPLNPPVWAQLKKQLHAASRVLILGDNAGEIVFDTLLVEQLQRRYPGMEVTYCVRGGNVLNDATREDAAYTGMDTLCTVIDNGAAISGTELAYIGQELQQAIAHADVILSKGSGNFESLAGCGLNVYYIFMCKCMRVAKLLGTRNMTAQLLSERELTIADPYVGSLD